MSSYVVATLYRFTPVPDPDALRAELLEVCRAHGTLGTLLVAGEGLNGTVASSRAGIDALLERLRARPGFETLAARESLADAPPFRRLKVRRKAEIVTFGQPDARPAERVGRYVEPQAWNELLRDPDVLLLDTRNDYEVAVGTFDGAVDPGITHFRQFADFVDAHLDPARHRKVAMFCTGGIRCEKASSYMLARGFEEVYHLRGGILHYLEATDPDHSLWRGRCFVFDERESVSEELRGEASPPDATPPPVTRRS